MDNISTAANQIEHYMTRAYVLSKLLIVSVLFILTVLIGYTLYVMYFHLELVEQAIEPPFFLPFAASILFFPTLILLFHYHLCYLKSKIKKMINNENKEAIKKRLLDKEYITEQNINHLKNIFISLR